MKAVFIFALFACAVAMIAADCVYSENDGEPECTAANVQTKYFRNNWDPTQYWQCNAVNQPAERVPCELSGYSETANACIQWNTWQWTEPCDPPSMLIKN